MKFLRVKRDYNQTGFLFYKPEVSDLQDLCGNIIVPDVCRDRAAGQSVSAAGTPALTVGPGRIQCVLLYCCVHQESAQMGDHGGLLSLV